MFDDCDGCILYQDRTDDLLIPRMVIPRVVKNDIRKYFPRMLANVYNSNDYLFMLSFMQTYYTPDFTLIQQLFGKPPFAWNCIHYSEPFHIGNIDQLPMGKYEFHGLEQCACYWRERVESMPDGIFQLIHSDIQILSDDIGVYRIDFRLSGTQLVVKEEVKVNALMVDTSDPLCPVYTFDKAIPPVVHSPDTLPTTTTTPPFNIEYDEDLLPHNQYDSSESKECISEMIFVDTFTGIAPTDPYIPARFIEYTTTPMVTCIPIEMKGELLCYFDVDSRVFMSLFNLHAV